MAEYKRIYFETVKRKWKELTGLTITGTISVFLLLWYLSSSGLITVNSYSYSQYCEGTEEDLCWAIINFTAKKDIYIYPLEYDPYGRNTPLEFNPGVKEWHLYRSWGKGWREINLSKTWSKKVNYAVKFAKGKTYLIKITALKNNPYWDNIKWSFTDALDPWWNSSWSYRQPINISNTAGDLTNYQVRIDLNSSNVGPNFNWSNNGSDIRFTNSTDDKLSFWIESWDLETTIYSFQKVHEKDLASEYGCWGSPFTVLKDLSTVIVYYQYPDIDNFSLYYTEYFFNNNTTGNTDNIVSSNSSRALVSGKSIKINDSFYVMSHTFYSLSSDKKWVQLRNSTDGYNFSNIIEDNVFGEESSKWAKSSGLKISSSEVWFYITWYNDSSSEWAVYRFIYYINNGSVSTPQKLFTETGGELRWPSIFKDNNTYYLYYGICYGTDSGLYARNSSDGVNFGSRIQLLSGSGEWRSSIVKLVDGKYYMVVSADDDTNVKLYKGDSPTSLSFVKTVFSSAYQPYMLKINDSRVVIVHSGKSIEHIYASVWDLEQEQTPNSTTIWVNVTFLPNNQNTTIYMYYGNSEASSASDGDGTFLFFDDFDTDTIGSKWQIQTGSDTFSDTSTSYAKINTAESRAEIDSVGWQVFVTKNYTIERPFVVESKANTEGYGSYGGGIIWYDKGTNINTNCEHAFADSDSLNLRHEDSGGSYTDYQGTSYSSEGNTWYVRNLILTSTQVISKTWTDNRNQDLGGYTLDNSANTGSKNIGLDHYVSGTSGTWAYFDWVFVRKYADPEPSASSFGSEESGGEETSFSITLNSPPNQTTTDDSTPDFNFTVSGTESAYSCELFINDTGYGTATANNNTATVITANQSLSDGTYDWYINCTAGGVTNQSEVREITIDATAPVLTFKPPTEPNGTTVPRNWTEVNITIDESNLDTFDFDWDYTELDDYLVGYWRFDNNSAYGENNTHFYDYSGTGNNGTCSGDYCPNYTEGKKQLGLKFDGVDDYVEVPDNDSLDITDEITIEAWVKPKVVDSDYHWIVSKDNGNTNLAYLLGLSTNVFRFITRNKNSDVDTGIGVMADVWYHVVGVDDGVNIKIYQNGVLANSAPVSGEFVVNDIDVIVGARIATNPIQFFNGIIDEVRIYNRALTAEEIKQRYLSTRTRYYDDSLVLAMNFNNNSAIGENSTKAVDISKYGNNGTIYGATWTTGKFGSALEFDGVDDYVDCGSDSSLTFGTSDFSWEGWFYLNDWTDDASEQNSLITRGGASHTEDGFRTAVFNDGRIWTAISDGSFRTEIFTSAGLIKLHKWYHFAVVYDRDANGIVYINGENKKAVDITGSNGSISTDRALRIGTWTPTQRLFNGKIDEVRIYNRALSEDEIKMHYLSEFQKYNSTQWRFYNNLTELEEGTYTYYGWANDTAGNEGQSEVREITIGQPDIKIEIWNGTDWILFNDTNLLEFRCEAGQTECEPTNQDVGNSQSIFKITNNGTGDGAKVEMKLNQTFTDITLKCDDDYTYADAVEITSSYQQIHGALSTNSYFYVSCWADYGTNPQPGYFDLHFQIS